MFIFFFCIKHVFLLNRMIDWLTNEKQSYITAEFNTWETFPTKSALVSTAIRTSKSAVFSAQLSSPTEWEMYNNDFKAQSYCQYWILWCYKQIKLEITIFFHPQKGKNRIKF